MIRLPNLDLDAFLQDQLNSYQSEIDAVPNFEDRVKKAAALWNSKSRRETPVFVAVRERLAEMCYGNSACAYCEDSLSHEIEHIKPKTFYPESTFVWANYLMACGRCNRAKLDKWAVYPESTGPYVELRRNSPRVPPISGEPVFLDPKGFDPLQHIRLDISGTFRFIPLQPTGTRSNERARYTIRILALNDQALVERRRGAYGHFILILEKCAARQERDQPECHDHSQPPAFGAVGYPFVWEEMKRSRDRMTELQDLFARVPQALEWSLHPALPDR